MKSKWWAIALGWFGFLIFVIKCLAGNEAGAGGMERLPYIGKFGTPNSVVCVSIIDTTEYEQRGLITLGRPNLSGIKYRNFYYFRFLAVNKGVRPQIMLAHSSSQKAIKVEIRRRVLQKALDVQSPAKQSDVIRRCLTIVAYGYGDEIRKYGSSNRGIDWNISSGIAGDFEGNFRDAQIGAQLAFADLFGANDKIFRGCPQFRGGNPQDYGEYGNHNGGDSNDDLVVVVVLDNASRHGQRPIGEHFESVAVALGTAGVISFCAWLVTRTGRRKRLK